MQPQELFGSVVIVIAGVSFPALLLYGLFAGRVPSIFGTTPLTRMLHRSLGLPDAKVSMIAARLDNPRHYWASIGLYAFLTLCTVPVMFALLFLGRAP